MGRKIKDPRTDAEIIRDAFDSIDMDTIAILRTMSNAECLQLLFTLCDAARDLAELTERKNNPNAPEWEIQLRIQVRMYEANDMTCKQVIQWSQSIGALDGWKIEY